jgi:hypothetical protein
MFTQSERSYLGEGEGDEKWLKLEISGYSQGSPKKMSGDGRTSLDTNYNFCKSFPTSGYINGLQVHSWNVRYFALFQVSPAFKTVLLSVQPNLICSDYNVFRR